MRDAADFAFRQALALCPSSPETVYRYVNFLMNGKRFDDALLLADLARKLDTGSGKFQALSAELRRLKSQNQGAPAGQNPALRN